MLDLVNHRSMKSGLRYSLEISIEAIPNRDIAAVINEEWGLNVDIFANAPKHLPKLHLAVCPERFWCGIIREIGVVLNGKPASSMTSSHQFWRKASIPVSGQIWRSRSLRSRGRTASPRSFSHSLRTMECCEEFLHAQ